MSKRQLRDNVRTVLNIIECGIEKYHNEKQADVIFLDAEKALDNLNCVFMFKVLGEIYSSDLKWFIFHSKQRLLFILIKGVCEIQKDMRQDYTLSPLLFILLLEVLNKDITQDEKIIGINIKKGSL